MSSEWYGASPFPKPPTATAPFMVFADALGYRPPSFKHPTRNAAEIEARRLADLNPGVTYYVLGALSVTSAPKAQATTRALAV